MVPQGPYVEKESVQFYTGGLCGSGIRARILWPAANPQAQFASANCLHFACGPGGLGLPGYRFRPAARKIVLIAARWTFILFSYRHPSEIVFLRSQISIICLAGLLTLVGKQTCPARL